MDFLIDGGRNDHQGISFVTLCREKNIAMPVQSPPGYINQIRKNFFPRRTTLEGQTTWSKMVKIDQNRRGSGITLA